MTCTLNIVSESIVTAMCSVVLLSVLVLLIRPALPCRSPTIAVSTETEKDPRDGTLYSFSTFEEDIEVFCSTDDATKLAIEKDGNRVPTTILNGTTIQLSIIKPSTDQCKFTCIDEATSCNQTLVAIVQPAFSVISPRVKVKKSEVRSRDTYFVPRGDAYRLTCTGRGPLRMYYDSGERLKPVSVNSTTIKLEAQANVSGISFLSCYSAGSNDNWILTDIRLLVDFYPEANNFQCISYGLHWRELECSWTSSSKSNRFQLYLVKAHSNLTHLLCSYGAGALTKTCFANNPEGTGSLVLQACNIDFCSNQTFSYKDSEIVKLEAPSELKLLNRSSHEVVLQWFSRFAWSKMFSVFKVEYRLLAAAWQQVNASLVQIPPYSDYCQFELALPCPDMHYEVRVFAKHVEALEDRFWSEPSSLFFFTNPSESDDMVDPRCNTALQEPEPITSVETGLNEIGKLVRETRREKLVVKALVKDLKAKLAKIRSLSEL